MMLEADDDVVEELKDEAELKSMKFKMGKEERPGCY